jgi:hypothetical protein
LSHLSHICRTFVTHLSHGEAERTKKKMTWPDGWSMAKDATPRWAAVGTGPPHQEVTHAKVITHKRWYSTRGGVTLQEAEAERTKRCYGYVTRGGWNVTREECFRGTKGPVGARPKAEGAWPQGGGVCFGTAVRSPPSVRIRHLRRRVLHICRGRKCNAWGL